MLGIFLNKTWMGSLKNFKSETQNHTRGYFKILNISWTQNQILNWSQKWNVGANLIYAGFDSLCNQKKENPKKLDKCSYTLWGW